MTRAQHGLVIFGNAKTLRRDPMWGLMLKTHEMQVFSDMLKATEFIEEQKKQWNLQSQGFQRPTDGKIRLELTKSKYVEPVAAI
jgi:hypothetical protein